MNKVFVLGIDGMSPELILKWLNFLPTFSKLMSKGWYAHIRSTVPPTSIAAWSAFFSGLDPGELDIFGYTRKSEPPNYKLTLVNSTHVRGQRIWDRLNNTDKKVIIFGPPLTYPASPVNGIMITDFLTPGFESNCVYPESLKKEITEILGGPLVFDVSEFANYRKMDSLDLIEKVTRLTKDHFKLVKHFLRTKPWDFFAFINYGSDRLHHTLWRYIDPTHRYYQYHPMLSEAVRNFYIFLDSQIAELLTLLGQETTLIVTSDHGMKKMEGRININDWFRQEGYLSLHDDFSDEVNCETKKINLARLDWSKTKVYALGAYECLLYVNKLGRERHGIVAERDYDKFLTELESKLYTIVDNYGRKLQTKIYRVDEIYKPGYSIEAPDLIVYFDNLSWGTNTDLGNKGLYSWANLVGPDDALHAPEGLYIQYGGKTDQCGPRPTIDITSRAAEILKILDV